MSRIPDLDEFLNNYRGQEWTLGNDTNCETCGISFNEARFDPDFNGINRWSFDYNVGCYNGASLFWSDEGREDRLNAMFEYLNTFPGWNKDAEDYVRNMIKESDDARSKDTNS